MPKAPAKSKKATLPNNADRPLSRTRYAHLLRDVQALVTTANEAVDQRKVQAQWQLGKRIAEERLSEQRGYHNSVIRDLATDMHTGVRNLQYAVTFHSTYKTCPKHPLSWTHYRILLDRPTAASRAHYTKLALDEALTSPELARRIAADQRATTGTDSALPRPTDPTYLYSATVVRVIDGDTLELSINLGFEVNRSGTFRLADIDCPELPSKNARAARDFVYDRLLGAQTIVVKTHRTDIHGRYVTHLFYAPEKVIAGVCFQEGTYLNAELLDANHAVLVV